ncbi:MAG TPA: hypothetical protein VK943_14370 [Arenibaculum sp.]|nr:hypothetical protein [Arenibaculum sp.]
MATTAQDREQEEMDHRLIADAHASIRLFHAFYGSGGQSEEWIRELVGKLYRMGKERGHGDRTPFLCSTADAIAKTYLGKSVHELEWPEALD